MDPWLLELIVVMQGSYNGSERRSISRDVERGLLTRVRRGVYVLSEAWEALGPEDRHIVRMRALAAVSSAPPVFSHWSAASAHRLPFIRPRSARVHVSGAGSAMTGRDGVAGHLATVDGPEIVDVGGLLVTTVARTVVDIAASSPFDQGVVVADGALYGGLPRELLEAAIDLAGARRGTPRAADVVAFAHPGAESANESEGRVSMLRLGVEIPELQHEIWDDRGLAGIVDTWWRRLRAIGEADGAKKYLDPKLAPNGTGQVLYAEKRREDRLRAQSSALARWGWRESCNPALLRPVLARIGVVSLPVRPTLPDWARAARPTRTRSRRQPYAPVRSTPSG